MADSLIQDMLDAAISTFIQPITMQLPHIKHVYLARMVIDETELDGPGISAQSEAGDTVATFCDRHFVDHSAPFRGRNNRVLFRRHGIDSIHSALPAGSEVVVNLKQRSVSFNPIGQAEVGEVVFLVMETENFRTDPTGAPRHVKVQLLNGQSSVLGGADQPLDITHEGTQKSEIEMEVGQFMINSDFTNRADFTDHAIARVTLAGDRDSKKQWLQDIGNITDANARFAPVYFKADAHTMNTDVPEFLFMYYGVAGSGEWTSDNFFYGDGHWFQLQNSGAPWMKYNMQEGHTFGGELETTDLVRDRANDHYYTVCGRRLTMPSQWCAVYVSFIAQQANYENPLNAGSQEFARSRSVVEIERPIYGAIAVWTNYINKAHVDAMSDGQKSHVGGLTNGSEVVTFSGVRYYKLFRGHVSTVFGKRDGSGNDRYLIMGGNQNDRVMVREYNCGSDAFAHINANHRRKFTGFFIPRDYEISMADGLSSAADTLEAHDHLLANHTYPTFEAANLAAIGVGLDASGANSD